MSQQALVRVKGLTVSYPPSGDTSAPALAGIDLDVGASECVAVVGESGSGKTTLARVLLGLLPPRALVRGTAIVGGVDTVDADRRTLRRLRGRTVGYVAQDPFAACDPLHSVSHHVEEAWRAVRTRVPDGGAKARLAALGIPDTTRTMRQRPHQWSGGMLQRATTAAAGVHGPLLTVADEPTSALDDELAADVLAAIRADARALLVITHDLRRVLPLADRIVVLHRGQVVENRIAADVLRDPHHHHTRALVDALPTPKSHYQPAAVRGRRVVEARDVVRTYRHRAHRTVAVNGVSVTVRAGELLGVHGRSGSGKSTLLRLLAGIEEPDTGSVLKSAATIGRSAWVMPVFQDARSSLDPRWPLRRILAEPLAVRTGFRWSHPAHADTVREGLASIGLGNLDPDRRPPQLSGGQCQRVAVLRALLAKPALIVADEPTSGLDPVNAALVTRMVRDAADRGIAVVMVSHDLARLESVADRLVRMSHGRVD